jgi:hypothetical protein
LKIRSQWPGLDTGLAANLEKMTTFSDHADRQLLAAKPYSTNVRANTEFNRSTQNDMTRLTYGASHLIQA